MHQSSNKQAGTHLKIKNLGLKIRQQQVITGGPLESGSTGGLQRANTMGDRLRSNSNNARQMIVSALYDD
jgi:hypothetical protein